MWTACNSSFTTTFIVSNFPNLESGEIAQRMLSLSMTLGQTSTLLSSRQVIVKG